jgi:hypothetical protein
MADLVNEAISWLQNGEPITGGSGGNSGGVLNRPLVQLLANDNGLQDRVDIIADDDGYYKKIVSSIKIIETDAATTARVQIDAAGLKQYDGTNKVVDFDESGNVTIGYGVNDKITVAAGTLAVLANELKITGAGNSGLELNNATAVGLTVTGAGTIGIDVLDATQYGLKLGNCAAGGYGPLHMVNAGVTGAANLHSTYGSAAVDTLAVDDAHDLFIKVGASTWQKVGATASPVAVIDTSIIIGTSTSDNAVVMDANGLTMRKAAGAIRFDVNEDGSWTLGNAAGAKVGFTTGDALSITSATLASCSISGEQIDSGTVAAVRIASLDTAKITTGAFHVDRIPNLSANKITSDTFATARIPDLSANKITSDTFATARIPDLSATYAIASKGVTNGDTHNHEGGDGDQISHNDLADKGTDSHATIDSHIDASVAHGVSSDLVGKDDVVILTNKRLTSPKINEDVVLTSTSTQIDAAIAESGNAILGDGTSGRVLRCSKIEIDWHWIDSDLVRIKFSSIFNGWASADTQLAKSGGPTNGWSLDSNGQYFTFDHATLDVIEIISISLSLTNTTPALYIPIFDEASDDLKISLSGWDGLLKDVTGGVAGDYSIFLVTFLTNA